ncbi:recombinase family protein [Bacteroides sp.]|uniref:recombinase family protein n=1 Tax=Bacteroides sp. TaxID=29523 RepID=UPI002613EBDA|nr:recombinase family protein [Bacteroides sp.]MDD3040525.1 recombinase family protein [Bacteroides sp.]
MSKHHFYQHYPSIEFKRAALYVRCSKEEQAKFGDTTEAQTEDLKAFALEHNLQVIDIYIDEGHTARKKFNKRKEFVRMLRDVELRKFDYIIFTKLDRWFRNIADFYKIQEILDNNGITWLTALERYEMETTNGKLNVNIRLSVAQDEADRDSDRIKDVFRLKVKKGEAITGSLPIGLTIGEGNKVIIDHDTVAIANDMFDYFELHNSKRATLLYLIDKYNRYFCYETIARALSNPLYKGEYRGNPDYCPKIIEPSRFDRIQVLTKRNVKKRPNNRFYVFSGLVQCKECGHALVANTTIRKDPRYKDITYYRCNVYTLSRSCTHSKGTSETFIESYLLDNIKPELEKYIANYELTLSKPVPKADPSKIKAKMKRLKELYINELIDIEDYRTEYEGYKEELEAITTSAEPPKKDLSPVRDFLDTDIKSIYESLTPQERRTLWCSIIDKIIIDNDKNIEIVFL